MEPLAIVAEIAAVLDNLRASYAIGGSLASSLHGIPRATNDADIVADLRLVHVDRFTDALSATFYVNAHTIRDAIDQRSSFNVIHLGTMLKVDLFVPGPDVWVIEELVRARAETVEAGGTTYTLRFATPEDTLLYKLAWYRLGGQQSERQWSDVAGIVKIQSDRLDRRYISHWARHLRVEDLVQRLFSEQDLTGPP